MTDIETLRDYCLSLPMATEDMAFGDDFLLFRVCGKIFACCGLERPDYFVVKCNAALALELRDRYAEIEPAWHWNKKYWNQLNVHGHLSEEFVKTLIRHSYAEVVRKLPRRTVSEHPEIGTIDATF